MGRLYVAVGFLHDGKLRLHGVNLSVFDVSGIFQRAFGLFPDIVVDKFIDISRHTGKVFFCPGVKGQMVKGQFVSKRLRRKDFRKILVDRVMQERSGKELKP